MKTQNPNACDVSLKNWCEDIEGCLELLDNALIGESASQKDKVAQITAHSLIRAVLGAAVQLERIADALDNRTRTE